MKNKFFVLMLMVLSFLCFNGTKSEAQVPSTIRTVATLPATCNGGSTQKAADFVVLINASGFAGQPYYCWEQNSWTPLVTYVYGGTFQTGPSASGSGAQTFSVGSNYSTLVLGQGNGPCCTQPDGSVWLGNNSLSNLLEHIQYTGDGGAYYIVMTTTDSNCDLIAGCTGSGAAVNQYYPNIIQPTLVDPTADSLALTLSTGDFFRLGYGLDLAIKGSVTGSPAFLPNDIISQPATGAVAFLVGAPTGSSPAIVRNVTGTPNNSSPWIGDANEATYTPTTIPSIPYCLATPTTLTILACYGSDNRFQGSWNAGSYSDFMFFLDLPSTAHQLIVSEGNANGNAPVGVGASTKGNLITDEGGTADPQSLPPTSFSITAYCVGSLNASAGTYALAPFESAVTSSGCPTETAGAVALLAPVTTIGGKCSITANSGVAATNNIAITLNDLTASTTANATISAGQTGSTTAVLTLAITRLDKLTVTYTISGSEAATNLRAEVLCW